MQKDDLTRYFELLPEADVVVMGAGTYMSWPMGQAWTFMNRHYCLSTGGTLERRMKIEEGKRFFAFFAQGSPDEDMYMKNYDAVCQPFEGMGFKRETPIVLTRANTEEKLEEIYQMGKAL